MLFSRTLVQAGHLDKMTSKANTTERIEMYQQDDERDRRNEIYQARSRERAAREGFDRELTRIRTRDDYHQLPYQTDNLVWSIIVDHLMAHRDEIEAEFERRATERRY